MSNKTSDVVNFLIASPNKCFSPSQIAEKLKHISRSSAARILSTLTQDIRAPHIEKYPRIYRVKYGLFSATNLQIDDKPKDIYSKERREFVDGVIKQYHKRLYTFIRNKLNDRNPDIHEIEDILHDIYLKLYLKEDYQSIENVKAFLFQSVRNVLNNRYLHYKLYQPALIELSDFAEDLQVQEPSAEEAILSKEQLKLVQEALSELPERSVKILMLSRFENLKYAQIAKKLNISTKSVEYQMKKVLEHLTARVDKE